MNKSWLDISTRWSPELRREMRNNLVKEERNKLAKLTNAIMEYREGAIGSADALITELEEILDV